MFIQLKGRACKITLKRTSWEDDVDNFHEMFNVNVFTAKLNKTSEGYAP